MLRLLWLVHLPFWQRLPHQALLPALGISLGVAAIIAIDLGSASTVSSFRNTLERLEGRTTHQILPGVDGLRGELAPELLKIDGVEAAAPVLEIMALGPEPLRLLGIDPFAETGIRQLGLEQFEGDPGSNASGLFLRFLSEPGALVISRPFLQRNGLSDGDSLELAVGSLRRRAFVLATLPEAVGDLQVPDNLALCDLATAQELSARNDVSRIDLVLSESGRSEVVQRLRAQLPAGVELRRPGGSARYLEGMLAALRLNLSALSYLALFVSLFLIYNAMLLAVLRRRTELGIVRCLGATRRDVLGAWLAEAAVIGALGTALGMVLGLLAGRFALEGIARTASDLYGYVRADAIELLPQSFIKAAVVGLGAALVAAVFPAGEAARTTPAHTSSRADVERTAGQRIRRAPLLALPLLLIFALSLALPNESPLPGYVAAVSLALMVALVVPFLGSWLLDRLRPGLQQLFGIVAGMAAQNIRASLSRTGIALAALTVALSMSIAMGTMVASFRQELRDWIADAVRADIYISPATAEVDRLQARLDPALVEELRAWPGVEAVDSYRGLMARIGDFNTFVAGVEVDVYRRSAQPRVLDGPAAQVLLDRLQSGQAAISETLMRRAGLAPGDRFELRAAGRDVELEVAGVYRDYSSDRGVVLLDRGRWEEAFGGQAPNSVALYLDSQYEVDDTVDRLQRELSNRYALLIRSNESLREQAYLVFDRTFVVARGLEIIGIAVAAIGILAALLAMLMERGRELATLRAVGLTRSQLRNLLLAESMLLAILAWLFALAAGTALSWILLRVINVRSFGWMLPFHAPVEQWMLNLVWSLIAAGLATVYPIWRSRRLAIATALREE